MEEKSKKSQVVDFQILNNGEIKIVVQSSIVDKNGAEISASDAIYFDPKSYTKYRLLNAILYGVNENGTTIYFQPDEYIATVTEDGDISVKITPTTEASKRAFLVLLLQIINDIYFASRTITTNAINRSMEKAMSNLATQEANTTLEKIEKDMVRTRRIYEIFSIAKSKNISKDDLLRMSIELTGKKQSAQWTDEDIDKMLNKVKEI